MLNIFEVLALIVTILYPNNYSNVHFVDPNDQYKLTEQTRKLGLVVCRGTQISLVCPLDGMEEIANPFDAAEEDVEA